MISSVTSTPYSSGGYGQYVDLEIQPSIITALPKYDIRRKSSSSFETYLNTLPDPDSEEDDSKKNNPTREFIGYVVVITILVACAYLLVWFPI